MEAILATALLAVIALLATALFTLRRDVRGVEREPHGMRVDVVDRLAKVEAKTHSHGS